MKVFRYYFCATIALAAEKRLTKDSSCEGLP